MIKANPITIRAALRNNWRYFVLSLAHFLLTIVFVTPLLAEGLDSATGENKVDISESVLTAARIGAKLFLFPLGYLVILNGSMALGFFVLNSLFWGFSPMWFRRLRDRLMRSKQARAKQDEPPNRGSLS
ncbi:MAG: hypothetical protein ACI8UO_004097 [Verrucomicrobiales bacterium]|jgi:hypothetical protein